MVAAAAGSGCATGLSGSPTAVSVEDAVVGGRVVSTVGGATSYWVEFGPTRAYGSETAHQQVTLEKNVAEEVSVRIPGLARATVYHYRLCAADSQQSGGGAGCGADRRLTTQSVACGQTVTEDVRLTGPLNCSSDTTGPVLGPHGLVIGAAGLDVNLAGYGIGGPTFGGGSDARGIDNSGGHDDLTVRNGTLGGWGHAIHLEGAGRNLLRDLELQGSPFGISTVGGAQNEIRASDVLGRITGMLAEGETDLVVAGSQLTGGAIGSPVMTIDATGGRIAHNDITAGFARSGIEVTGSGNHVVENTATAGTGFGLVTGISLLSGSDNVVAENEIADAVLVIPSQTEGSQGDGIFVGPLATGTLVRDNFSHDNEGDGIEVQSAATRLRGNRADDNGDLGIQAVAGVIDLGGNSASGNGNPLQCTNVFCD